MAANGLSSGLASLIEGARNYFVETFENPPILEKSDLEGVLGWVPSLHIEINKYLTVLVEASEEAVYPQIMRLRHAEILEVHRPIVVYSVCPLEVSLKQVQQNDIQAMEKFGYGLLTVNGEGVASKRLTAIPLIQHISAQEYRVQVEDMGQKIRRRLAQSFENYRNSAPSGVTDITEVVEGLILKAGRDAIKKGWLTKADAKPGFSANTLDALSAHKSTNSQNATWGGARNFIHQHRNTSHHFPANKAQSAKKYRDCRHAFLEGIQIIGSICRACKAVGLSGALPDA